MTERANEGGKNKGREALLNAVGTLIAERPFDDVTIDDIIRAAGVSRSSFYYHFSGGKDELRAALVARGLLPDEPVQDTRQAIIEAAAQVFARCGVMGTTLEDIVNEAGVSRGSLNWYFHSKEELFAAIVNYYKTQVMTHSVIEQVLRELQQESDLNDEIALRRLAGAFYDAILGNPQSDMIRMAVLIAYTHPQAASILSENMPGRRKYIAEYVRRRQEEGYFNKDVNPIIFVQMLAAFFLVYTIGRGIGGFLPETNLSREELIDQVVTLLLYGINHRPS